MATKEEIQYQKLSGIMKELESMWPPSISLIQRLINQGYEAGYDAASAEKDTRDWHLEELQRHCSHRYIQGICIDCGHLS